MVIVKSHSLGRPLLSMILEDPTMYQHPSNYLPSGVEKVRVSPPPPQDTKDARPRLAQFLTVLSLCGSTMQLFIGQERAGRPMRSGGVAWGGSSGGGGGAQCGPGATSHTLSSQCSSVPTLSVTHNTSIATLCRLSRADFLQFSGSGCVLFVAVTPTLPFWISTKERPTFSSGESVHLIRLSVYVIGCVILN